MPIFWEEIKKYDVMYNAGGQNESGYDYKASIGLRHDDNSLIGAAHPGCAIPSCTATACLVQDMGRFPTMLSYKIIK